MSQSKNPAFPSAHPTAPGGMSEAALVVELVEKHGWNRAEAKALKWPAKIDAVVEERRAAELVARVREHGVGVLEPEDEAGDADRLHDHGPQMPGPDGEMPEDPDDILAELDEMLAESAPPCEGCLDPDCTECFETVTLPEGPHPLAPPAPVFIGVPGTRDYIFDGHRGAGPSAAERWIACTASLGASRAFLETLTPNQQRAFSQANTAARQGTTAHAAAEVEARVLLGEIEATEAEQTLLELAVEPDTDDEAYNDEMAGYISEYTDLVQSYIESHGAENVLIERRVSAAIPLLTATDGEEDVYEIDGSLDLGVLPVAPKRRGSSGKQRLVVGDLKYGEGIDVDPDSNPQVRIYALGLLAEIVETYDGLPDWLTDVDYIIVQPRLGGIKTWTESIDDLLDWQDNVLSKALTEALAGARGGAAFNPGPVQCQWCPVRGACPALAEARIADAGELFDTIVEAEYADGPGAFPETDLLDNARLGALYAQIKGLTDIAKALKEEAERRLFRGEQVPGFQLVDYQPPRKWKDNAVEELEDGDWDALFQRKLITPTAAEKLLPEDDYAVIAPLVDKPAKRPVIAPEGDRRKTWTGRPPEQMFSNLDDE